MKAEIKLQTQTEEQTARIQFPFTAIVGQEQMKRALICNAIDPLVGGILIAGTRGTAKSTAVRSLAALLPKIEIVAGDAFNSAPQNAAAETRRIATPFVNLPVGATEDRVLGTLDVGRVLQSGERHFEPGLLAKANRGMLYVDEVNLLPDHLVDVLLDAVAMGINRVEREGISFEHEARVMLVGTMNPEEGELRPQLLDRFGLCVEIAGYFDAEARKEVTRRRIRFDNDAEKFAAEWRETEQELAKRIAMAQKFLAEVVVPEARLDEIADLCVEAQVEGLRADIVIYKTARTFAAFDDRPEVNSDDIVEAAELALAHRRRAPRTNPPPQRKPPQNNQSPDNSQNDSGDNEQSKNETPPNEQNIPTNDEPQESSPELPKDSTANQSQENDDKNDDSPNRSQEQKGRGENSPEETEQSPVGEAVVISLQSNLKNRRYDRKLGGQAQGKRRAAISRTSQGAFVRAIIPRAGDKLDIAIESTVRAAALAVITPRNEFENTNFQLEIHPEHLRIKQRRIRTRNSIVFLVDGSGSMAGERMKAAKAAVCSLLEEAYQKRDEVSLIAFRGTFAEELLPPTRSAVFAYRQLSELPTGGRTPLADGLKQVRRSIQRQKLKNQAAHPFLVLVTDGRATFPAKNGLEAALAEADFLREMAVECLCIDTEGGWLRFGQTKTIAARLGATYAHVSELPPKQWSRVVREWVAAASRAGGKIAA